MSVLLWETVWLREAMTLYYHIPEPTHNTEFDMQISTVYWTIEIDRQRGWGKTDFFFDLHE